MFQPRAKRACCEAVRSTASAAQRSVAHFLKRSVLLGSERSSLREAASEANRIALHTLGSERRSPKRHALVSRSGSFPHSFKHQTTATQADSTQPKHASQVKTCTFSCTRIVPNISWSELFVNSHACEARIVNCFLGRSALFLFAVFQSFLWSF